jgi:hypothetical protein
MVRLPLRAILAATVVWCCASVSSGQQSGSIRGVVSDKDFDVPLAGAEVLIVELNQKTTTADGGSYTLVFSKDGYIRQVQGDVAVSEGAMTDVSIALPGEVTVIDDFVCTDSNLNVEGMDKLINLREQSAALVSAISSDLMKAAAAGDAASALKLVSGASVQEGKYAVIRGLPDRYVSSQMNGVRLPTADVDKRAVQLDQFQATVIDSMQVVKTFTPDQQGDASGGAVNVVLKNIPDQNLLRFEINFGVNTQSSFSDDFLYPSGKRMNWLGLGLDSQPGDLSQPVAIEEGDAPLLYNFQVSGGGKIQLPKKWKAGGFGSFYYKRDQLFYDDGKADYLWILGPGEKPTPATNQGSFEGGDFKTSLLDITRSSYEINWGGLGAVGIENENNWLRLLYMYTSSGRETITIAQDTRGKHYYFPDYQRDDPAHPGNEIGPQAAPYTRTETVEYTQRTTQTLQLSGRHTLDIPKWGIKKFFMFQQPELDWTGALSSSTLDQPDKRQLGMQWWASRYIPSAQIVEEHRWLPYRPGASTNIGNLQRIWKDISEDSTQYFINFKYPFEQWTGDKGYFKVGVFSDNVDRQYNQDSFGNPEAFAANPSDWTHPWSLDWDRQGQPVVPAFIDVDYTGKQKITAWYYMIDMPLCKYLSVIGGMRYERTELSIVNFPDVKADGTTDVLWYPLPDRYPFKLRAGDADVSFQQDDALPSLGLVVKPVDKVKINAVYTETVARQTFKELTPIQQMEYLGGPVFIGNPDLQMSSVRNWDLRLDYTPSAGSLYSVGWFYKSVQDPIEVVQRVAAFTPFSYTTAMNFPKGRLWGWEFEVRQKMDPVHKALKGLTLGGNLTLISSEVEVPEYDRKVLSQSSIDRDTRTRDMTQAPKYLVNLYGVYDIEKTQTQLALFYTVKGDTLVAGAGESLGNYVPDVYELPYGTLNFTATQCLNKYWKVRFQAKNLLNPAIETVYRADGVDTVRTSYTKGMEFWIGLAAEF